MPDTLGSLRAELLLELRGDLQTNKDVALVNAKINNALENIWMSMMQAQIARFLGADSPVTFTLPAGAERVQLVSIPDPTVPLQIVAVAGGEIPASGTAITCGYTYVTESGSETQLSPTTNLVIGANQIGQATPPLPTPQAIGWNFYYQSTADVGLSLQNQQPLPFNVVYNEPTSGWQDYPTSQQTAPLAQGATQATPASAPPPSENSTGDNISWIKHLEIRTSDTALRSWNQYDIDSAIGRNFAGSIASSSEYQHYAWDLINGNRLEIRPKTGTAFTPRYFYIAKPRRLRFDQADMPYVQITGVHEFLTNQAIADLKLALDEYLSSQAYSTKAAAIKQDIVKSLRQEDWGKNSRVQPHLH